MLDDWNITHERADLPPQVWEFLKSRGFFAMIIPKKYGGLEFSAYAHSCVLAKIASRSATTSSTVAVPNSLGPAELLNHYGTEEQKNHYLPRLARGEEVPCFALTGPRAGSDAGSIPDTGVVCRGLWQGREMHRTEAELLQALHHARAGGDRHRAGVPHVRSGASCSAARPISASPARSSRATPRASASGGAISRSTSRSRTAPSRGATCSCRWISSSAGRRMAGNGWRMLVEQLSVGRCISLPSNATGGAKAGVWATGAYARIRNQFNTPVGRFEGRRGGDRAHGGSHLHHGRGALGDRRRHRRRREALGPFRDAQVPRHRDGPAGGQRRHGRARRQGHLLGPAATTWAAATRWCRWRSRSRAPTS